MRTDFLTRAPLENLRRRAQLARQLRGFFDDRGFLEVQTPVLSQWCIIDRHLDPVRVDGREVLGGQSLRDWYLQTSPEQSMKRLLTSGIGSIYQLGPVFRSGEFGQLHNPEFTMAEWYDVGADLDQGLTLLDALCMELLHTDSAKRAHFSDVFHQHTELDLFSTSTDLLAYGARRAAWWTTPLGATTGTIGST
jgi:elongation factor P--(R)-beta-lysine ligase